MTVNVQHKPTLVDLIKLRRAIPSPPATDPVRATLAERFLIPPFSVLDARQGYWQKRKKMWIALGIKSELGRGGTDGSATPPHPPTITQNPDGTLNYGGTEGQAQRFDAQRQPPKNGYRGANAGMQDTADELRIDNYRRSARSNATPGGSPFPATTLKDGKTQRDDGRGRPLAQTYGSGGPGDLAAGFKGRGAHPIPGGGTGKNSAYLFKTEVGYRSLKEIQAEETDLTTTGAENLYGAYGQEDDTSRRIAAAQPQSGTSIFDPVLCELAYRWFSPVGGRILDPFAGGSVRGIVAARLGRAYDGIELRQEQADANWKQAVELCPQAGSLLRWVVGDALDMGKLLPGGYDFVFSCPPYADLERYSDDPRDLSTMEYDRFLEVYRTIITESCAMLRNDRFACFVVGDVRDRATGCYRNFVGDTVRAFRDAGLELYNDAVLITAVGSLPIRVGKQFSGYRKLGKTHQNVLVFVKGDAARAATACGEVDVDFLAMPEYTDGAVAMCLQNVRGTMVEPWLSTAGCEDVDVIRLPAPESYLLCDIVRGQARASGREVPRCWVAVDGGWKRLEDTDDITYLIGDEVYMNPVLFPESNRPADAPVAAQRMRGT